MLYTRGSTTGTTFRYHTDGPITGGGGILRYFGHPRRLKKPTASELHARVSEKCLILFGPEQVWLSLLREKPV